MNQQTADELIDKAVKKAIKEYNKEQKDEKKKKALHNTKLLLKNYKDIKDSVENAISESSQLEDNYNGFDDEDEVYIQSIRRSKLRSIIVLAHIDTAIASVEDKYKKTPEKYDAFMDCMMKQMSFEEAAEKYNAGSSTVRKWVNDVTKSVSIMVFGIDGLELI